MSARRRSETTDLGGSVRPVRGVMTQVANRPARG